MIDLVWPTNDRMLFVRALSGILRSARSLATFVVVGFLSAAILAAFREATGQTPARDRRGVGLIAAEPAAKNDNS